MTAACVCRKPAAASSLPVTWAQAALSCQQALHSLVPQGLPEIHCSYNKCCQGTHSANRHGCASFRQLTHRKLPFSLLLHLHELHRA